MPQNSIKQKILSFLSEKQGQFVYGGQIEDFIRTTDGHKASNASRRCRELEDAGQIESRYVQVPGVANRVVQYRIVNGSGQTVSHLPHKQEIAGSIPASRTKFCFYCYRKMVHPANAVCATKVEPVEKETQQQSMFKNY